LTLILSAHRGNDTGGTGYRIARGFRLQPDREWVFRSSCNPTAVFSWISYPEDVTWSPLEVRRLFAEADVFHARNDWGTLRSLEGSKRIPSVIHYHGTNFRTLWPTRLREQRERRAIGLVSTLDLLLIAPDQAEWLPSPYDVDWLQQIAREG
jgi:hypothetical protein